MNMTRPFHFAKTECYGYTSGLQQKNLIPLSFLQISCIVEISPPQSIPNPTLISNFGFHSCCTNWQQDKSLILQK
jgi:hypothetical protein